MRDSRLTQATALLDDARCLLVDIVEEGPSEAERNALAAAHQFINGALVHIQSADDTHQGGTDGAP